MRKRSDLVEKVAGIVLAGGQGTRLLPLTENRCKPAVCFGGRYRLIDIPLSNALNSKITNLFVISQHFTSHLNQHILSTYKLEHFQQGGLQLLSPHEGEAGTRGFQGTADAVRKNIDTLVQSSADYFLILSGDQLYNMDLGELVQFAHDKQAEMVIASLYVSEKDAKRMGVLQANFDCHVTDFYEKPQEKAVLERFACPQRTSTPYLASMGIYVFRRDVLLALLQEQGDDFGHHLIPKQAAKGGTYAYVYKGYWVDIGTVGSFYAANMALLDHQNCLDTYDEEYPIYTKSSHLSSPFISHASIRQSLIGLGSVIEGAEIERSVLGMRCHIKKGTTIRDSVLMGHPPSHMPGNLHARRSSPFSIGENCLIEKAILDEQTSVGNNVRLVNEHKLDDYEGEGICIRDGIIIVKTGTILPDGFTL